MAKSNPALESNLIAVITLALGLGDFPCGNAFLYLARILLGLFLGQFPSFGVGIKYRRIHGAWSYRITDNWRSRNTILGVVIHIFLNPPGQSAAAKSIASG